LLLHANRVVPVDRLIDAVWDDAPPATVLTQLHAQVSALRGVLAPGGGQPLETQAPGYLLREPARVRLKYLSDGEPASTRR
jgi:DNA-binding SARP family transcriptional activator